MKNFLILPAFVMLFLTSSLFAQAERIFIDGDFSDWENVSVLYDDPSGDNGSGIVDFGKLWVSNDEERLLISLETGAEINFQNDNEITVYIDGDDNSSTGYQIGGVGAELSYSFGERSGYVYDMNGNSTRIEHYQAGMISAPTVTSDRFEISFDRNAEVGGPIFTSNVIKIYFKDYSGADIIPNEGTISYQFDENAFPPFPSFSIKKESAGYVRLTAYNVLHDGIFDPNLYDHFQKILKALQPDIISFEEVSGHSAADMVSLLNEMIPRPSGSWRAVQSDYDVIVASVFPITETFDITTADGRKRSAAFLLDMRPKFETGFLVIGAHLKCCGGENNDAKRQREVDAIMEFIREAKESGGVLTIPDNTPIAILGDMNFVGSWKQPYTLLTGDISDNGDYGEDFAPDWDESDFTDASPFVNSSPFSFTWYDEGSSYPPGKLDYLIYSDSVLKLKNAFALFTPFLSDEQLNENGLLSSDVPLASDHLPVVADFEFVNVTGANDESGSQIGSFELFQNYPNPFSKSSGGDSQTVIKYSIKSAKAKSAVGDASRFVTLKVYDILGRRIATLVNEIQKPGEYKVAFNAGNIPSGNYIYVLKTGAFVSAKIMTLIF